MSIKYTERLAEAGIEPSVGSVGDSYDNALAETINGLYKAEVIHRRGPWPSFEAVEYATLEWVDWFNNRRLLEPIGNIPPAEAEEQYYAPRTTSIWQCDSQSSASGKPGAVQSTADQHVHLTQLRNDLLFAEPAAAHLRPTPSRRTLPKIGHISGAHVTCYPRLPFAIRRTTPVSSPPAGAGKV